MPAHADALTYLLLGVVAAVAGALNAVAGGGSLLSFPALLLTGCTPVVANVTNAVALLPGYIGGSFGYRRELAGQRGRVALLGALSVVGAVVGAWLLISGPARVFQGLVPWLVLGACALLALQTVIARRWTQLHRRSSERLPAGLVAAQLLAAVYGGYFGAAMGVIMLAVLGIFIPDTLQRLNALKGVLSLIISIASVVFFIFFASVVWRFVAVMAPASLIGGQLGVVVARRLDDRILRGFIIVFGTAVGIRLFFS